MRYWIIDKIGTTSVDEFTLEGYPEDTYVVPLLYLVDGKNDPFIIYEKLKETLGQFCLGKRILFICYAGLSRSNGMATTLIAYLQNLDWEDAYTITRKACPRAQVCMDFRDSCLIALQMMRERLVKRCAFCNTPIEYWEECCAYCWTKRRP
jgi:hypothetical protein